MPAMKPFFLSKCPILTPGAALVPETAVFRLETAPPFGAGAALDAPGAEFPLPGAALAVVGEEFRRAVASMNVAGAEFRRPGAPLAVAGAALHQTGGAPISQTEAPAAWCGAPIARSGHPATRGAAIFEGSADTPLRNGNPAGKSARAPLCPQPFALCFT